jgi:superoxide dismutase, Cu-Zn family
MRHIQRVLGIVTFAGVLVAATACASSTSGPAGAPSAAPASSSASSPAPGHTEPKQVSGTFGSGPVAYTYDKALVPDGAKVSVSEQVNDGRTTVKLDVHGLKPNRTYGAHVHAKPCGPKGDDAGPHYQNVPDPVKPSVDPRYANPKNEIWLDFTTDAKGDAVHESTVDWTFGVPSAGSVVIHADKTKTEPGQAGMAGARLACISVPF